MTHWSTSDILPLAGKLAIVTGSGGIGFEAALALARAGCAVIIAGRDPDKGADALDRIRRAVPVARVEFEQVDLASLASIARFAETMASRHEQIDLLINDAGVMTPPKRLVTQDGFELQFGTNHLGHFALTGRLMPLLRQADGPA